MQVIAAVVENGVRPVERVDRIGFILSGLIENHRGGAATLSSVSSAGPTAKEEWLN
jgi:hypothetical protein